MSELVTLPAPITGKFNIALTQTNFQKLADKAASLIFNEDNLEEIKKFLDDVRKVDKAIDETHKDGKAEALKIGRDWDSAKNAFKSQTAAIVSKPQSEYTRICNEVEDRKRKQQQEAQRVHTIKTGIETNAIQFAKDIAGCTTLQDLTNVERKINLEKTRKDKYMEFLDDATKRYTELNALLKSQKDTVKDLERIAAEKLKAEQEQDEAKLIELEAQKEAAEMKVEEAKIIVQETAINQSLKEEIPVAQEIIPEVKARRTAWYFEVVNEKEVMKKSPELVVFAIDDEKVKLMMKTLKDSGQFEGKTEQIVNGIRFYEKKTF